MQKQTLQQAGLKHVGFDPKTRLHMLQDIGDGSLSQWVANKHHASYGLIYKNTLLEFVSGNQG